MNWQALQHSFPDLWIYKKAAQHTRWSAEYLQMWTVKIDWIYLYLTFTQKIERRCWSNSLVWSGHKIGENVTTCWHNLYNFRVVKKLLCKQRLQSCWKWLFWNYWIRTPLVRMMSWFFMLQVRSTILKLQSKFNVLEGGGELNHNIPEPFITSPQKSSLGKTNNLSHFGGSYGRLHLKNYTEAISTYHIIW